MASISFIMRTSTLLLIKSKFILLSKNASQQSLKGKLVETIQNNGITTISMARPPVNSLSLEMAVELRKAIENSIDNNTKGIILTSSLASVFSGGLDILEMYKPDLKRCTDFWHSLQDLWLTLYSLGIPTAAAINGASPAGGCLLALSCEYRVMVDGLHTIGLNETKLGIVAPKWFQDPLIATIGYRQAELALLRGTLFKPQEALKVGLVDELASNKTDALTKCISYITDYAKISTEARTATKLSLRKETLTWLEGNREWDTTIFLNYVQLPQVQTNLDLYIQSLKKKSK
ncbi:PREDICTED: enoyl-CoA delta isomerase 1, mitochondrial-like [Ceratosolen solmsi marchali]|uniref:Enoyl-CoA delta isomerase 1, mitochondrial n=1 Tax=Ceratosolen solmsi marchali TaxID=326594 RepID=A0AAJ7DXB3_9HYME|nr:PREDICTED: enoyl-CoA delta isomerase 1, mitochondrial-like [Ceratosolen solmsi marchali]